MAYLIEFTPKSIEDIEYHKKSGNKIPLSRILLMLTELSDDPFVGIGKPEALKHRLSGFWSRRIDKGHRLIYDLKDNIVTIHSARGHY